MAKVIAMPSSPNFTKSDFTLRRMVGAVASPYTGKVRTQEFDGVFWEAVVSLPPMRRSQAVEWQSFLLELNGPVNHFKFADPDALTNQGTYSANDLESHLRANTSSVTLSFTTAGVITAPSSSTVFTSLEVGDYIVISGSEKVSNNGTMKVTVKTNAYTITVDPVDSGALEAKTSDTGCKVQTNIKGAKGLTLRASGNSVTGTIKKGDYLQITGSSTAGSDPVQYVMVTEDATKTTKSGKDTYGIRIEPKLRADLSSGYKVRFASPKGLFRLMGTDAATWSADNISNYGINFSCQEVII